VCVWRSSPLCRSDVFFACAFPFCPRALTRPPFLAVYWTVPSGPPSLDAAWDRQAPTHPSSHPHPHEIRGERGPGEPPAGRKNGRRRRPAAASAPAPAPGAAKRRLELLGLFLHHHTPHSRPPILALFSAPAARPLRPPAPPLPSIARFVRRRNAHAARARGRIGRPSPRSSGRRTRGGGGGGATREARDFVFAPSLPPLPSRSPPGHARPPAPSRDGRGDPIPPSPPRSRSFCPRRKKRTRSITLEATRDFDTGSNQNEKH